MTSRVGQNLFESQSSEVDGSLSLDWRRAINSWYGEISQFPNSAVAEYEFYAGTGHYSQLVWANTSRLGCGLTEYR